MARKLNIIFWIQIFAVFDHLLVTKSYKLSGYLRDLISSSRRLNEVTISSMTVTIYSIWTLLRSSIVSTAPTLMVWCSTLPSFLVIVEFRISLAIFVVFSVRYSHCALPVSSGFLYAPSVLCAFLQFFCFNHILVNETIHRKGWVFTFEFN